MPYYSSVRVATTCRTGFLQTPMIHIIVGTDEDSQGFFIHQGIIFDRSEFFANLEQGNWLENEENVVKLPEDEPATFALYQELLYTQVLPIKSAALDSEDATDTIDEIVSEEYAALSKLYVLAEKLLDPKTKKIVLDALLARSREKADGNLYYPSLDSVRIIYDGTPEDSPARAMLVTMYNDFGNENFLYEPPGAIPQDFLYDLSLSMLKKRPRQAEVDSKISAWNRDTVSKIQEKDREIRSLQSRLPIRDRNTQSIRNRRASFSSSIIFSESE